MQQTTVTYERGTGGPLCSVVINGTWREVDGGIEFEHDIPERRVPARTMTTWVPLHRVVCTETREV